MVCHGLRARQLEWKREQARENRIQRFRFGEIRKQIGEQTGRIGKQVLHTCYRQVAVPDFFQVFDSALESGDPVQALRSLADELRAGGRYDLLFDIRGMIARLELGLPPIWNAPAASFPAELRPKYDEAVYAAAREAGRLYLEAGNIPAGYRYFHAIGETAPVIAALDGLGADYDPGEQLEGVIAIALEHGLHPRKGIELILHRHGMCRAITAFGMYPVEKDRRECIAMLVRELHAEVVDRMRRTIEQQEGAASATKSLPELMTGRDWLFGEYDYYVDTSHLTSLIPYCLEPVDAITLGLIDELCEYGRHLSQNFVFRGQPPFENGYVGYQHYSRALLGRDTEVNITYFREKLAEPVAADVAQVLVMLLARIGRYREGLDIFVDYLTGEDPAYLRCPGAIELALEAHETRRMADIARERQDVVSYAAARVLAAR